MFLEHCYSFEHCYNMNELRFVIRVNELFRILINIHKKQNWKVIQDKQEWITPIKCINVIGVTLLPLFIFKAQHMNSAWILFETSLDWQLSTSNSNWISNSHSYKWLNTVSKLNTCLINLMQQHLFIINGHNTHMTANFSAFCMEHLIDLIILPPPYFASVSATWCWHVFTIEICTSWWD